VVRAEAVPVAAVTAEPDTVEAITQEASPEAVAALDGEMELEAEAQAAQDSLREAGHQVVGLSAPSMAQRFRLQDPAGTSSADRARAAELHSIQMQEVFG
jgi:hypothetical protein